MKKHQDIIVQPLRNKQMEKTNGEKKWRIIKKTLRTNKFHMTQSQKTPKKKDDRSIVYRMHLLPNGRDFSCELKPAKRNIHCITLLPLQEVSASFFHVFSKSFHVVFSFFVRSLYFCMVLHNPDQSISIQHFA